MSTSFLKQEPPKPGPALRKYFPMRWSVPRTWATSLMSAPVSSQRAEKALMEEMRWANIALAASLDISLDQTLVVMMRSRGTQGV